MLPGALAVALLAAPGPAAEPGVSVTRLLDRAYPLEATVSFPAGLFHWVDSLAGTSGGKTIPQYRAEYVRTFGALDEASKAELGSFRRARIDHASRAGYGGHERGAPSLLGAFLAAPDVPAALGSMGARLGTDEAAAIRDALDHFAPRYRMLWRDGEIARAFIDASRSDPARPALTRLLADVARFFGVDPRASDEPRVVLVPVPPGGGTHAEAVGRFLLIEIRRGEGLRDQIPPIVHENAHLLWDRMGEARLERLEAAARELPNGAAAWQVLREALPTALGQGVAARRFHGGRWSLTAGWYHTAVVDEYAKRIYPSVQRAIDQRRRLDAALVREWAAAFP